MTNKCEQVIFEEVKKAIKLIKTNSGYGEIVIKIFDCKVSNVKIQISKNIK